MSALLFAPHNDDETLFASYLLIRHKPTVVVVFADTRTQSDTHGRVRETLDACEALGVDSVHQWSYPNRPASGDWLEAMPRVRADMDAIAREGRYELVLAPWPEPGGHDQHNAVGEAVEEAFSAEALGASSPSVVFYPTYRRGHGRTQAGLEHVPSDPSWYGLKLKAMSCYASQIAAANTRPWFFDAAAMREWLV